MTTSRYHIRLTDASSSTLPWTFLVGYCPWTRVLINPSMMTSPSHRCALDRSRHELQAFIGEWLLRGKRFWLLFYADILSSCREVSGVLTRNHKETVVEISDLLAKTCCHRSIIQSGDWENTPRLAKMIERLLETMKQ